MAGWREACIEAGQGGFGISAMMENYRFFEADGVGSGLDLHVITHRQIVSCHSFSPLSTYSNLFCLTSFC